MEDSKERSIWSTVKKEISKISVVDYFENYAAKRNDIALKKNEAMYEWIRSLSKIGAY